MPIPMKKSHSTGLYKLPYTKKMYLHDSHNYITLIIIAIWTNFKYKPTNILCKSKLETFEGRINNWAKKISKNEANYWALTLSHNKVKSSSNTFIHCQNTTGMCDTFWVYAVAGFTQLGLIGWLQHNNNRNLHFFSFQV